MEIFKLFGSIFVDTDEADKSLQKTESSASKVASGLGKTASTIGKVGLAVGGAAIAAGTAVTKLVSSTSDEYAEFEQLTGGIETMFGESSQKMIDYANQAYLNAGMSANEYMDSVMGFSASLLQSLDGDTEKAAESANLALIDMADNANKMGTNIDSIKTAYAGFAKQNYTMLDNLKLGYGGTKTEMERLLADAQELTGVEYNIDSLDDVYSAIHAIQTEMGITGTTAKEGTTTLEGSMNTIKSMFENMKTEIGGAFAPLIQSVLSMVIEKLPDIQALVERLVPIITQTLDNIIPVLGEVVDSLLPALEPLIEALLPLFTLLCETLLPLIADFLSLISDILVKYVIPAITKAVEWVETAVTKVVDFFKNFKTNMENVWSAIVEVFKKPINAVIGFINKLVEGVVTGVNTIIKALNNLSFDVPDWVPILGGKTFGFNLNELVAPQIPLLAKGGTLSSTGSVIVGEKGPELLNLPQGASVTPLDKASIDYDRLTQSFLSALLEAAPSIRTTIAPDKDRLFKVMQDKSREYNRLTGKESFA